jgi:hypothetical protein
MYRSSSSAKVVEKMKSTRLRVEARASQQGQPRRVVQHDELPDYLTSLKLLVIASYS